MIEHPQLSNYTISTDKNKLNSKMIFEFLKTTYWAKDRTFEQIEDSINHAFCFGLYEGIKQVGFGRVVTDFAVFAYLGDVFILPDQRGKGLGKWLIHSILNHAKFKNVSWLLATKDAHPLYEKFGFLPHSNPERLMTRKPQPFALM